MKFLLFVLNLIISSIADLSTVRRGCLDRCTLDVDFYIMKENLPVRSTPLVHDFDIL